MYPKVPKHASPPKMRKNARNKKIATKSKQRPEVSDSKQSEERAHTQQSACSSRRKKSQKYLKGTKDPAKKHNPLAKKEIGSDLNQGTVMVRNKEFKIDGCLLGLPSVTFCQIKSSSMKDLTQKVVLPQTNNMEK